MIDYRIVNGKKVSLYEEVNGYSIIIENPNGKYSVDFFDKYSDALWIFNRYVSYGEYL